MKNMDKLTDMILNESENRRLDFKREKYHKGNYVSLLKDIIAFANVPLEGSKYIVIGVKEDPEGNKVFHEVDNIEDQANLENLIHENIEPLIDFEYYQKIVRGNKLAIIEIKEQNDFPYMMKKDYKNLKHGEMYIRKGTRQTLVYREDLDSILDYKTKNIFAQNIKIGLNHNLNDEVKKDYTTLSSSNELPSVKYKEELKQLLDELTEHTKAGKEEVGSQTAFGVLANLGSILQGQRVTDEGIIIGSDQFGVPIRKNEKQLRDLIARSSEIYAEEDGHYIYNNMAIPLELYIYNEAEKYLEDVTISLEIPSDKIYIFKEKAEKPVTSSPYNLTKYPEVNRLIDEYPEIEESEGYYTIREYWGNIEHKKLTAVFSEAPRFFLKNTDAKNIDVEIEFLIRAKNLPDPIQGSLNMKIEIKESA